MVTGVLLLAIVLSGVVLLYEPDLQKLAHPSLYAATPAERTISAVLPGDRPAEYEALESKPVEERSVTMAQAERIARDIVPTGRLSCCSDSRRCCSP